MRSNSVVLLAVSLPLCAASAASAAAPGGPALFWGSDPVRPGETVMVFGAGFGDRPVIEVARLPDSSAGEPGALLAEWPRGGHAVAAIQPEDTVVKFTLPAGLKPGIFAYRITGPTGAVVGSLNRPAIWWCQGDVGITAQPGGWVRLLGKNLVCNGKPKTKVLLQGPQRLTLTPAAADAYAVTVELPRDLPPGEYQVFLHTGCGGRVAWSDAARIVVAVPPVWPQTVLNAKDLGADPTGTRDSTAAVQAALAKAQEAGGGIVYFPRGRYHLSDALTIPRCTVLRGEKQELTCLFWPDRDEPPKAWLVGTNSFGVEDLTCYCSNYKTFLSADTKGEDAGDVFLRRVRIRADIYRGHMKAEEVDRRYRAGLGGFGGGYWLAVLGGRNLEVTDCDLYSSSCVLSLTNARGARVEGNLLGSGRWGGSGVFGGDGVILARNRYVGCDLMSWGAAGGLGYGNLSHVYLAHNTFDLEHGGDRESITSDAPGGIYHGPVAGSAADGITLPVPLAGTDPRRLGAAVHIVAGTGVGQWRQVTAVEGARLLVDRPWDVRPDTTSTVAVGWRLHHWLVLNNRFADVGIAVQFYGASIEHIVAGNRCERAGGYQAIGKPYGSYQVPPETRPTNQPSWYCQFLDNDIDEGNIYRSGANNAILAGESVIGVYGWPPTKDWKWPFNRGAVVRGNRLHSNAGIHVGGSANELPAARDVLIEGNLLAHADAGILLDRATAGIVLRGNRFEAVGKPLTGAGLDAAWLAPGQRAEAEQCRCRALAAAAGLKDDPAAWPAVAEALERLAGAEAEPAARATADAVGAVLERLATARADYPLGTVGDRLGLQLAVAPESTLARTLEAGKGGTATLVLAVSSSQTWPWQVKSSVAWPPGWEPAAETSPPQPLGIATKLVLSVTVPAGAWGTRELPVVLALCLPKGELRLSERLSVGSGALRDWMVVGPFPNRTKYPLDLTLYPPDDGLDLAAEYDGAAGKVRWQPVHTADQWLDLAARFKTKGPGVAYALAAVTAEVEAPVVLRLGSSGGVSLVLNGQYTWASQASRNAGPDQDRVPLTLRAGDNTLLFKVSTATEAWRFTAELTPAPGSGVLERLAPLQPEAFAGRPAFSPPPPRAAAGTGPEVLHPSGVDWRLVYADDFTGTQLGPRWRSAVGKWEARDGVLASSGDRAFLAYAEALRAPLRIEYDAQPVGPTAGDLSAFWLRDPADYLSGVLVGFGSNGNTLNKAVVGGEQVATADRPLVQPGRWHHVIAQVLANGHVQLIVDGQLSLDAAGKPAAEAWLPGLWTWGPGGAFRNVRLYTASAGPAR